MRWDVITTKRFALTAAALLVAVGLLFFLITSVWIAIVQSDPPRVISNQDPKYRAYQATLAWLNAFRAVGDAMLTGGIAAGIVGFALPRAPSVRATAIATPDAPLQPKPAVAFSAAGPSPAPAVRPPEAGILTAEEAMKAMRRPNRRR